MAEDYVYDIFLSYCRRPPVGDWVRHHFYPLLKDWLPQVMPREPQIFIDLEGIETGSQWPLQLKNALKTSRCLLSVCSPDYFRSPWCRAELYSMIKREHLLGYRTEKQPCGLIYPVVFSDGEHFPIEVQQMQLKDLEPWNSPSLVFAETREFLDLEQQVKSITKDLWRMIDTTPKWQNNWPVFMPESDDDNHDDVKVKIPRL